MPGGGGRGTAPRPGGGRERVGRRRGGPGRRAPLPGLSRLPPRLLVLLVSFLESPERLSSRVRDCFLRCGVTQSGIREGSPRIPYFLSH